jgi:CrcB protein
MSAMSSTSARLALWNTAVLYVCVAVGSVCGGVARYLASILLDLGSGFPWATLFVNATGSFLIGFYAALSGPEGRILASARQRQFLTTGFCGGYTTFSTFSLETFRAWHMGETRLAALNIGVSVVSWLLAVWVGHVLAGRINRMKGA